MPLDASDESRRWDMLNACREIVEISAGESEHTLKHDARYRRAIERLIFIVGEAANAVSSEVRDANTHIPWRKIIGQRHFLAHEYDQINVANLWSVVSVHVPQLISDLERILSSESDCA